MRETQLEWNVIFKRVQVFTVNWDGSSQWTDEALHSTEQRETPFIRLISRCNRDINSASARIGVWVK